MDVEQIAMMSSVDSYFAGELLHRSELRCLWMHVQQIAMMSSVDGYFAAVLPG